MEKAQLYSQTNGLQKRDTLLVLKEFLPKMSWKEQGETILDIGCGSGDVTKSVLLPLLPKSSVGKIVGVDVSKEMVDFASKNFSHNLIDYQQLDIQSATNPQQILNQTFTKIMSFYCLHWIQDQESCLKNMYYLLEDEGEILLVFLASNPIFTMYENMSLKERWQKYMKDVSKYIPAFQYKKTPAEDFKNIAENAGFEVEYCDALEMSFPFQNLNYLKNALSAVNPFVNRLPENEKDNFLNESLQELIRICPRKDNGAIIANYKLMVASLKKSTFIILQ